MGVTVSGVGLNVRLIASQTFPQGFDITHFADDADPLDLPAIQQGNAEMGLNGDLVRWDSAVPIPMVIAVIPTTTSHLNLAVLAERNRVGRGKTSARDQITAVVRYPDNNIVTLTGGIITNAPAGRSVASAKRQKSMVYSFMFENRVGEA